MRRIIGICGGIGSGKSVVSRMLRNAGHVVFDCDYEARRIMEESADMKRMIRDEISSEVTDGISPVDRKKLAAIVFGDEDKRCRLNSIVHGRVVQEVKGVANLRESGLMFVESAIMAESGLADICDKIWVIMADHEERIARIAARDGSDRRAIESRMKSQRKEAELLRNYYEKTVVIRNDPYHSLLARIELLLKES